MNAVRLLCYFLHGLLVASKTIETIECNSDERIEESKKIKKILRVTHLREAQSTSEPSRAGTKAKLIFIEFYSMRHT